MGKEQEEKTEFAHKPGEIFASEHRVHELDHVVLEKGASKGVDALRYVALCQAYDFEYIIDEKKASEHDKWFFTSQIQWIHSINESEKIEAYPCPTCFNYQVRRHFGLPVYPRDWKVEKHPD